MAKNNKEIEIRIKVEKSTNLIDFLSKNAKYIGEFFQKDEYFTPAHRDFLKANPILEWLRVRNSDNNKYSITYKKWHKDESGKTNHCTEYEIKLDDNEKMKLLLKTLDFKSILIVEKVRKIWTFQNYEVALDKVKNLGDFIEIEFIGDEKNQKPQEITDAMINFLKDHDCGEIRRDWQGYPFALLFPDRVESEIQ